MTQLNELNPLEEAAIARALKYFESDMKGTPTPGSGLKTIVEIPKFRFRVLWSKVYPGWTRVCDHCSAVQHPLGGAFATFYHKCEYRGVTVEWPASIGRNYA